MQHRLCIFLEDLLRRVVSVPPGGLTIGRDPENDLTLEDPLVSRRHARLSYAHERLWIEDCESANGTLVDGAAVDRRAVDAGDAIEIGPFRLVLEPAGATAAPRPDATLRTDPAAAAAAVPPAGELGALIGLLDSFDVKAPREELFTRLLRPLLGAMDAERAFLYRANTRHGTVRMIFTHLAPAADAALPVSESAVLAVAREREPVLITDLIGERGKELGSFDRLSLARVRSVMIAPLLHGRKLVGVLYLDSASCRRRFLSKDLALLARAATCLAGLLDSVQVTQELEEENDRLRTMVGEVGAGEVPLERLHAPDSPMERVVTELKRAAAKNVTVLLLGETGTGKEVAARALHRLSDRRRARFVAINCGAVPEPLVESELFGYRKGAFSGAVEDRAGLIEIAHGGTLFLDEVGELPAGVQVKLLRVLEERAVQRLGSTDSIPVDFRLVAATHRDLDERVAAGAFRLDLYYRLKVLSIQVPALRDRRMDLPLLLEHLIATLAPRLGSPVTGPAADLLPALAAHDWPGNVRELRNVLERALVLEESTRLTAASLPDDLRAPARPTAPAATSSPGATPATAVSPFHEEQREFERRYFQRLFEQVGHSVAAMARASGLTRLTIYRKLGQLGLERSRGDRG